uniref:(northern house mosquito) hypothetical protein n=1 Tax=Culex pipiens TaxID=7175 RepID=A0A8D8ALW9_CULPI
MRRGHSADDDGDGRRERCLTGDMRRGNSADDDGDGRRERCLTGDGESTGDMRRGDSADDDGDGRRERCLTGDGESFGDMRRRDSADDDGNGDLSSSFQVLFWSGDAAMTGEIDTPAFTMYRICSSRSGVVIFTFDKMVICSCSGMTE